MIADDNEGTMQKRFPHIIGYSWASVDAFRRSLIPPMQTCI